MTKHEKAFRAAFPRATIEQRTTNGGKKYYLVRKSRSAFMYSASADTKAVAWQRAAATLSGDTRLADGAGAPARDINMSPSLRAKMEAGETLT